MSTVIDYTMSNADYHARPELGHSGLLTLLDVPARYVYEREQGRRETDAMRTGSIIHAAVLGTPGEVRVGTEDSWSTKAGRAEHAQAVEDGVLLAKPAEWARAETIRDAVMGHPAAGPLFESGQPEVSVFGTDLWTGVPVKARPDWLDTSRGLIVDFKTTEDASPAGFATSVARYGYHVQAAHYLDLLAELADRWLFIAVEKQPPHLVGVYELSPDDLAVGAERRARALDLWLDCTAAGRWPAYPDEITTLNLPGWAYRED